MVICPNCGNQVGETDAFCSHCGCQFVVQPAQSVESVYTEPVYQQPVQPVQPVQPEQPKKKQENSLALIGLILSIAGALQMLPIIGSVVGLVLSIMGLKKSKELEGEGKLMAGIGLGVAIFTLVGWVASGIIGILGVILNFVGPFAIFAEMFNNFVELISKYGG